ncbi:MAG: hypothetical protein B0D92_00595 [Spirochaeta sp. LUC14_002_19_P3]|nr:MAG: hypothetical protein B0D92_00595 [Spirochaeta sp. LUC14_002_19_P3]
MPLTLDHLFLFLYIIAVSFTSAAVVLSLLYWMQKRNPGRFNTFILFAYLTLLLLLGGVRFYLEELLSGGKGTAVGIGLAEFAGYALLLYYLPATVNHIAGRRWSALRLTAAVTASMVYFILGVVYLFSGFFKPVAIAAALLYILSLAVILVDIVRGIPQIKQGSTRAAVLLITMLTITFLPLVMIGRLMDGSGERWEISLSLRFLFLSLYYFMMAISAIIFYLKEMSANPTDEIPLVTTSARLPLTAREQDIAASILKGLTYNEIAENLSISPNTVRNHVANVYKKLSVSSKMELFNVLQGKS